MAAAATRVCSNCGAAHRISRAHTVKRLLLLGGGHSHVEVLRQFGARPPTGVEVTLASPLRDTPYSGMLPGLIAGHYNYRECHVDLEPLARHAGARFLQAPAGSLDAARRAATLADGTAIDYDIVSIDVGATPAAGGVPGAAEHAIAVKPVAAMLTAWNALIERAHAGGVRKIAVVGGGAAGVEILLAMQYRLAQQLAPDAVHYALITDADQILPGHNFGVRAAFQRVFDERQVEVHLASLAVRVEPHVVIAANGKRVEADAILWATGATAPPQLGNTGLMLDPDGFIAVNEHLQSLSHPEVFAAGDCATIHGPAYPKSGVYAVRQGPPLAENLRRALAGKPLVTYRPQRRALALISTGDKYAVASYGPLVLKGAWVWNWKNYIDRKFMAKYNGPA